MQETSETVLSSGDNGTLMLTVAIGVVVVIAIAVVAVIIVKKNKQD